MLQFSLDMFFKIYSFLNVFTGFIDAALNTLYPMATAEIMNISMIDKTNVRALEA
jgi:hypothetical protein